MVPYEMGCFSGYCVQTDAIFRIIAAELGLDPKRLRVFPVKGNDPGPGITCELLRSPAPAYPDNASERTRHLIEDIWMNAPFTCFTYDLKWHDVSVDLSANPVPKR